MENATLPNMSFPAVSESLFTPQALATEHDWYYISVRFIQAVLTVVGNLMVVIAVVRFENLRCPTNYLITGLACADLMAGMSPFFLVAQKLLAGTETWLRVCLSGEIINSVATLANILHIFLLGVDRYIYIVHPFKYECMVNAMTIKIASAFVWLNCVVVSCVLVPVFSSLRLGMACRIALIADRLMAVYIGEMSACILAVIVIYLRIAWEAWRHSRQIVAQGMPNNDMFTSGLKIAKMTAWVLGGYLISVTPMIFTQCLIGTTQVQYHVLERASVILWWNNSWINPVIYAYKNKELRRAFRSLLGCPQINLQSENGLVIVAT